MDPSRDAFERLVERVVVADPHRVRDRPVKGAALTKFLVGQIADGDNQVPSSLDITYPLRMRASQCQLTTLRGCERPRVDPLRGVRPGRNRRDVARLAPQRCREVRASGVSSTDEKHPSSAVYADGREVCQLVAD